MRKWEDRAKCQSRMQTFRILRPIMWGRSERAEERFSHRRLIPGRVCEVTLVDAWLF